ncbi:MAG: hypothetical protein ABJA78_19185 [Ferruginibacter sp.]
MEFSRKVVLAEDIINILGFFVAFFVLRRKKNIPKYMITFFWYPVVALSFTIFYFLKEYLKLFPSQFYSVANNLSLLFHFVFLSIFIINSEHTKTKKRSYLVFWGFLILVIISLILKDISFGNRLAFGIANSGLVILCIFYYYSIVKNTGSLALAADPSFWVANGIFFGMILNVPTYIARNFIDKENSYEIWSVLFAVCSFAYIIMHIFFIKAYLCIIRPHKLI